MRDSRAVAHSVQRKKVNLAMRRDNAYLPTLKPESIAFKWLFSNLGAHFLTMISHKYIRCFYEDLVDHPGKFIRQILDDLDINDNSKLTVNSSVWLELDHSVLGNPDRFTKGQIDIHADVDWQTELSSFDRAKVTSITWPLLLYYGYFRRWIHAA